MKVFLVLCLGFLAVQASPILKDPIDDLVKDLEDLNRDVTAQQSDAIDQLGGELGSLDQLSQELLRNLGDDLVRDAGILADQVHELERQAQEYRVDISECIGSRLEEINNLPQHQLGEAGICANRAHAQAQQAVDEGFERIAQAIGPIDEYWRRLERCREADREEQEICLAELHSEIINDKIQIPAKIHLAVGEVLGHLEAEKPTLLLCVADGTERLNEEGGHIVQEITECAQHLFPHPPQIAVVKAVVKAASNPLQDVIDDLVKDLEDLNRDVTAQQSDAIDQLGGELASLDELSQGLLRDLGEDLVRDAGILADQVHELERQAREYRVDISECIGSRLEEINNLPQHQLGEAGICANRAHAQAQQAVDEGFVRIAIAIGPIDEYWRRLERCREADREEQEICLAELHSEIINDKIQIPAKIHLAVGEVLGHLEAEKPTLLLCVADGTERLNEEGGHIVQEITECAQHLFPNPPQIAVVKAVVKAASNPLQDVIDDLVKDLEDLNRDVTAQQSDAIDQLGGELASLDELSQGLLRDLGEDLVRDAGILADQVHELERQAREYRVDISECIGSRLEEINNLPQHQLGEAGICANRAHAQAQQAVDEGFVRIAIAIGPIDEYWRRLERCREADRQEQEICLAELHSEIINDKIQIPAKIHLAVGEVLGHLEAEKPTLLLCVADGTERLNEEGGHIVQEITECAQHLFPHPPQIAVVKAASNPLQDVIDDLVKDLEDLNRDVTAQQSDAIDQLGGELASLDELSQGLLRDLGEDLVRDAGILADQVQELERQAREYRVDISECIGSRLEEINNLPQHQLGEAGICANEAHAQAQRAVDEGFVRIAVAVGPIDEYWRRLERCREADRQEQEICLAELHSEIINDKIQIPAKIHLAVGEVLGHLEAEKPTLLLCVADGTERLNEEGGHIVQQITECAQHLFPHPPTH